MLFFGSLLIANTSQDKLLKSMLNFGYPFTRRADHIVIINEESMRNLLGEKLLAVSFN